jgi:predicted TIM-barrel fold metal-dependent hydrolase
MCAQAAGGTAAIDTCVAHDWGRIEDLAPYMSAGWQAAFLRPGNPDGPIQARGMPLYRHPFGPREDSAYPEQGPAGSDRELLTRQLLDGTERERIVLGHGEAGILTTAYTNSAAAQVLTRALNDWTLEHWLEADPRFFGLLLVSTAIPLEAAAEIRRHGDNERFVGIALGTNGLDRPFGQAAYHPVYEAAAEVGLPIVIRAGSDTGTSLSTLPVGGGVASTYAETEIWGAHPLMAHLTSLVMDGVFELFPGLELLLVGGGVTWYPPFTWRLDAAWSHTRSEAPLLSEPPSEYLRRSVRLSTAGMEHPADPTKLATVLGTLPSMRETLIYGSGYPNRGWEQPDAVVERLPEEWASAILRDNAAAFFRFPDDDAIVDPKRTLRTPEVSR